MCLVCFSVILRDSFSNLSTACYHVSSGGENVVGNICKSLIVNSHFCCYTFPCSSQFHLDFGKSTYKRRKKWKLFSYQTIYVVRTSIVTFRDVRRTDTISASMGTVVCIILVLSLSFLRSLHPPRVQNMSVRKQQQ